MCPSPVEHNPARDAHDARVALAHQRQTETTRLKAAREAVLRELRLSRQAAIDADLVNAKTATSDASGSVDLAAKTAVPPTPFSALAPLQLPLGAELRRHGFFQTEEINQMLSQQYLALLADLTDGQSGWAALARVQNVDVQNQLLRHVANAAAESSAAATRASTEPADATLPSGSSAMPSPAALKRFVIVRCPDASNRLPF